MQTRPLTLRQVQLIKVHIESELEDSEKGSTDKGQRDLALFCTAVDTMLRAGDLLKLTVEDVADEMGAIRAEFPVTMGKTGKTLVVQLFPFTRKRLAKWIKSSGKEGPDHLFTRVRSRGLDYMFKPIGVRRYELLVKEWIGKYLHISTKEYSGHSLRKTRAAYIYQRTRNLEVCRRLLGHANIQTTIRYLGIDERTALDVARQFEM